MLDFNHVMNTPNADIQVFYGDTQNTLTQWQTWRKPRGAKFIYLLGVGGGGSGGTGLNTGTTSGGGAGGGSGSQSIVMIPSLMVPDVLYIQAGVGGVAPTTSATAGNPGQPTYVCIEPDTTLTANMTLLYALGSNGTQTPPTAAAGGLPSTASSAATLTNMPLAGRGFTSLIAGQAGNSGGTNTTIGNSITVPTTGLIVTGGAGGGGCNAGTGFNGGAISSVTGALGQDFYPSVAGGAAAITSTPGGNGSNFIVKNSLMYYGGTGGGGATTTAGGTAGIGGDGAPGCGGGGGGGSNSTNPIVGAGNGGPGFVYIIST